MKEAESISRFPFVLKQGFAMKPRLAWNSLCSPVLPQDLEISILIEEGQQSFPALSFLKDVSGVTCFSWLKENHKCTNRITRIYCYHFDTPADFITTLSILSLCQQITVATTGCIADATLQRLETYLENRTQGRDQLFMGRPAPVDTPKSQLL